MNTWLAYYNKRDPGRQLLGRVRVEKYGASWSLSRGAYRRIMERIHQYDKKGVPGFAGPVGLLGQPVSLATWKINSDGTEKLEITYLTTIGSVF